MGRALEEVSRWTRPFDRVRETGPALEAHYRFILWLVPTADGFPRRQKFLLGARIQQSALDVLESLVEATYTRQRGPIWPVPVAEPSNCGPPKGG